MSTYDQKNVQESLAAWQGHNVIGSDGQKLGKAEEFYVDEDSGKPEWVLVSTGMFGSKSTFVPLQGSGAAGDDLKVAYDKAKVKDAPRMEADGRLSPEEEDELYRYYGIGGGTQTATTGRETATSGGDVARDTSGPESDTAMTRSEEELKVGKTQRETGRARLRKYIVTENVTTTVPVQREEVRIEREPITDANRDQAMSGKDLSEEEAEMTLHEEEVVTEKRVVPKERVRLDKEVVTDERQVSEEVRKERIDTEGVETEGADKTRRPKR